MMHQLGFTLISSLLFYPLDRLFLFVFNMGVYAAQVLV